MTTSSATTVAAPALPVIMTLAHRELVRFFRQRNRVFGALGQPIIFWLLFSEGLRGNQLDYAHFFPGTLVMILLFTAIFATITIIEDRNEGFPAIGARGARPAVGDGAGENPRRRRDRDDPGAAVFDPRRADARPR